METFQALVTKTHDLLTTHKEKRNAISSHFSSVKLDNDTYIAQLLVNIRGNNIVIEEHNAYLSSLKTNQRSVSRSKTNTLNTQNNDGKYSDVQIKGSDVDRDITQLRSDVETCSGEIEKTKIKLEEISSSKKALEKKFVKLTNSIEKLRNKLLQNNNGFADNTSKIVDGVRSIDDVLNTVQHDFQEERQQVEILEKLLKTTINQEHMPQTIPEYRPEGQFRVKPGAFMVGGRETRDSNNGFHELSARIANLTRQINRVTAV
jgi:chromosome segregation ATPase